MCFIRHEDRCSCVRPDPDPDPPQTTLPFGCFHCAQKKLDMAGYLNYINSFNLAIKGLLENQRGITQICSPSNTTAVPLNGPFETRLKEVSVFKYSNAWMVELSHSSPRYNYCLGDWSSLLISWETFHVGPFPRPHPLGGAP